MVYETARMIAGLLEATGLFRQVFIHGGPPEKAAEEILREPGAAVIYTGEEGQPAGSALRREPVFSVVLKTLTLGRGENAMKASGDALDGVLEALRGLSPAFWRVTDLSSGGRESLYRIDLSLRLKG
ncbi:hypothetical protein EP073_12030 [Geovibrio thiophilus]|uniref:DUF3168 domain-containing protein n=1 Tax=Geovibrio thiophilus TaxID=139438 RepID=A0A410K1B5_9BACT|nr:hypothetical protein [Geovibrio thiophilus]QAR34105.1 hypothetical protein EP073_12030 [Geovibrio thiophilus]